MSPEIAPKIVGGEGPLVVRMLQGMAGEHLVLEPGDLYRTTPEQAEIWATHDVAEIVKQESKGATARATER
jgi:hypothetical protein